MKAKSLLLALTAGLTGFAGTTKASIVVLDVSAYNGINGGVAAGSSSIISIATNVNLLFMNDFSPNPGRTFTGLSSINNADNFGSTASIAYDTTAGRINSVPFAYTFGQSVKTTTGSSIVPVSGGSTAIWTSFAETIVTASSWYSAGTFASPDFTSSHYLGFLTSAGKYGWLNTSWTASTGRFQILGGAYENLSGVDIAAGDTGTSAVPEPSGLCALGGLCLAGLMLRRRTA